MHHLYGARSHGLGVLDALNDSAFRRVLARRGLREYYSRVLHISLPTFPIKSHARRGLLAMRSNRHHALVPHFVFCPYLRHLPGCDTAVVREVVPDVGGEASGTPAPVVPVAKLPWRASTILSIQASCSGVKGGSPSRSS